MTTEDRSRRALFENLFRRAQIDRNDRRYARPSPQDGFGGTLLRGGACYAWSHRGFSSYELVQLSRAIRTPEEAVVIFPLSLVDVIGQETLRSVMDDKGPIIIPRDTVISHAHCVVKKHAVVYLDTPPPDAACIHFPRSLATSVIYGSA